MKAVSFSIFIFAFLLAATVQGQRNWRGTLTGEGPAVKEELSLDAFHSIGLSISGTVYLKPGATQKVVIEGQKNLIDNIKQEVTNGTWEIAFDKNVQGKADIKIYITLPTVKTLAIGGSGKIITQEAFNGLGTLKFSIGGSGNIEFAGTAESVNISIGGSGSVKAADLKVQSSKVSIGGSGNCYIEVAERLDVSIGGSGKVNYKGRPKINSSIAGSGKVVSMD